MNKELICINNSSLILTFQITMKCCKATQGESTKNWKSYILIVN